jgi:2,4-dienoyl-CoA reductase-like NADH-dependent reductase (Old Yellow Enzyme family)
VLPEGRITYADVGLYDDASEAAMRRTLEAIRYCSNIPVAIQLSHAGRKASTEVPWKKSTQFAPGTPLGWQTEAPSAIPFADDYFAPVALDRAGLKRVRDAFVTSARRAHNVGIDAIQLHVGHGYLLHQFISPLSNQRDDEYGGSLENRIRYPLEVFSAVRDAFPADKPVTIRISGTDWVEGGWDIEQTIALAQAAEKLGSDAIHITSGGLHPAQKIPVGPNYQVPLARAVKQAVKMPVIAVGLITEFEQAEAIVGTGDADLIAIARAILYDPRWPWHAAAELGAKVRAPSPYLRSQPRRFKDLFESE